jgi:hypothetical protein
MHKIHKKHRVWKYKNITLLFLSLILLFNFMGTDLAQQMLEKISELGFLGIFLAGLFFVSTFTVIPAGIVLFALSTSNNIFLVALIAGLGSVVGDYLIFRFLKDGVFLELQPIFNKLGGSELSRLIRTPFFAWFAPVVGALIIASPFPDEIGIGLMGISKLKNWQFISISFLLNSVGILFIIEAVKLI